MRRAIVASVVVAAAIALVTLGVLLARRQSSSAGPEASVTTRRSLVTVPTTTSTVVRTSTSVATSSTKPRSTTSTVPDIIPGFHATNSLTQFLAQLQRDPLYVGDAGPALTSNLQRVLDTKAPPKRAAAAATLRRSMQVWVDDGTLDPDIADALDTLLAGIG